ncbi:MAG: Eco57I restriction-modification methylase domain-containing protein [Bacteroidetes bacterium]|nr:Eco57I restriction-modification methylase domain-containing protein [Bacteroidota bacterium]
MPTNRIQLQEALQKPYDRLFFAKNVLKEIFGTSFTLNSSLVKPSIETNQSESAVIGAIGIYGKILLEDGSEITCYEINLKPNVKIEYSKVAIQHYVRKLLTAGQAALINFVSPTNKNVWRLTFVAKDSVITEKGIAEKSTFAKRYTYLLGPSETCKTAAERFEILSVETKINLETIIKAFSVEKLSKAFFDEYTIHYEKFIDYLNKSNFKKSVFNGDEKAIRDFTKKLLGRIVFLYFVQKKGWLGATDINYKDGMPDFMIQLFNKSGRNDSFYPNWLSRLFFDTLNNNRQNDVFEMPDGAKVKVPFLNGGLFDKEDYDYKILTFKAKLFHNSDNDEDPKYRGFFDFLNAYNFTIYEDSPDEKTIAVDPEMLGHIFENLLEDNKDKGAYYTPKEIVYYMCQESLIEYLTTHLSKEYKVYQPLGKEQTEFFGNETREGQLKLLEEIGDKTLNREDVSNLVKTKDISGLTKEHLKRIDQLLDSVKICDPAIGSGAFPMGLLLEIQSIKEAIAYETGKEWKPAEVKEQIIQNTIYGVDIEKGAVDIARLRFWLSLVVDEDKPKPLPNLDYKIVVGNSLVSKYGEEVVEINWERRGSYGKAEEYVENVKTLLRKVAEKQKEYFKSDNTYKKGISSKIRNLKIELLINQLLLNKCIYHNNNAEVIDSGFGLTAAEIKKNTEIQITLANFDKQINKLTNLLKDKNLPFNHFDWKLDFPEILNPYIVGDNAGFDIVIANPPYIKEYTNREAFDGFRESKYYQGKMDIWYGFASILLDYIKPDGVQCFIAQNNWITSAGASGFRHKVHTECKIILFTDFGNYKVFETAGIQTMIYLIKKQKQIKQYPIKYSVMQDEKISKSKLNSFLDFYTKNNYSSKYIFNLNPFEIKESPFTFNTTDVEIVLNYIKKKSNLYLYENEVAQGIVFPQDFVNKSSKIKLNNQFNVGDGIFALNNIEKKNLNLDPDERKIIKPYFTSEQFSNYYSNPQNQFWIIYTDSKFKNPRNVKPYPNIKKHLDRFKNVITSDNKPYGLHRAREEKFFKGEKIIAKRKCADRPSFSYSDFDCYVSATFYIIKSSRINLKYLTALMNSRLIEFWLRNKGKMQGHNFQIDKEPLLAIPIYKPEDTTQFEKIVDYIIFLKANEDQYKNYTDYFEILLDGMFYDLYLVDSVERNHCGILKHLGEIPEISVKMDNDEKLKIITKVYNRFNKEDHQVKINLIKIRELQEIKIIEGQV